MGSADLSDQLENLFSDLAGLTDETESNGSELPDVDAWPADVSFVSSSLDDLFSVPPQPEPDAPPAPDAPHPALKLFGLLALLFVATGLIYLAWPKADSAAVAAAPVATPTPALAAAIHLPPVDHPPAPTAVPRPALAVPPIPPDGLLRVVTPAPQSIGWATSQDGATYVSVPNVHAGRLNGHTYYGIVQFDLSGVPPQATITYAALELTGLDDQYRGQQGQWQLQLLTPKFNRFQGNLTYKMLNEAPVEVSIGAALSAAELAAGQVNTFVFNPDQLAALQTHLANGRATFRLAGPADGSDNRFTWDSGYRNAVPLESLPALTLVIIPPPEPEMAVVTSTPPPENVITAAALAATATAVATRVGTFTPVPSHWVTPILIAPTPTPANTATAEYLAAVATAETFLFGTATATPLNLWTVTPAPTVSPTATQTPTGTPPPATATPPYVLVTSTPTPENAVTAAALSVRATALAAEFGPATRVPANWATPKVVTVTPVPPPPGNQATATFRSQLATAEAFLFEQSGPAFMWTATPTPYLLPVNGLVATPWAEGTPTPAPVSAPAELVGKIAFLSNRSGGPEPLRRPLVYVVDPDGGNLSVLADPSIYEAAVARDSYSADLRFYAFVKDAVRFDGSSVPALYWQDSFYHAEEQLTHFGQGIAWQPVWSPTREQIAFVSNDSRDDEIWVVNRDGSNLLRLTDTNEGFNAREIGKDTFVAEVNGHPSWSPDGSQLVFWSNRTGHREIWIMAADGSAAHSISLGGFEDWDPVWIKYTDTAPNPAP